MPRFELREFSTPDYRGSLPERDPNNAIWPRLSALGKMLQDISWEEKGEPTPEEVELEKLAAIDDMKNYNSSVGAAEDQMAGYKPNTLEQDREVMVDEQQRRVNGNYTGGHRDPSGGVNMERQKAMADAGNLEHASFVSSFNPKTASKEDIRKMQRMIAPADAKLADPDSNSTLGYFDDGSWGKASQQAYERYLKDWGYLK